MGALRAKPSQDIAAIVTPGCQVYMASRGRCVVGQEALRLQGIQHRRWQARMQQGLNKSSGRGLLLDLGGNAFNAHCNAAILLVREALLGRLWFRARAAAAARLPRELGEWGGLVEFETESV